MLASEVRHVGRVGGRLDGAAAVNGGLDVALDGGAGEGRGEKVGGLALFDDDALFAEGCGLDAEDAPRGLAEFDGFGEDGVCVFKIALDEGDFGGGLGRKLFGRGGVCVSGDGEDGKVVGDGNERVDESTALMAGCAEDQDGELLLLLLSHCV